MRLLEELRSRNAPEIIAFCRAEGCVERHGVIAVILIEPSIVDCLQEKTSWLGFHRSLITLGLGARWHLCPECHRALLVSILYWPLLEDNQCMAYFIELCSSATSQM